VNSVPEQPQALLWDEVIKMIKTLDARMAAARTRLLLDFPWFGSLAMRLHVSENPEIKTFSTDGTNLYYNADFLANVSDVELTGIIGHEVMHCALLHPFRRGDRDLKVWNQACDYAINSEILKSGLRLPSDCLLDSQYDGLSAEVIYARLAKQPKEDCGNNPEDGAQSTGDVQDAPSEPDDTQMAESDWKIATEQASDVARMCGKLPGTIAEQVKQARSNPADWRAILREFVEHTVPSDYSWMSPNRRFISNGVYLPGMVKENLGHIAVAVDTSGSIDQKLLAAFCSELNSIVNEAKADGVTVIYCDSRVQKTEEFAQDEEIVLNAIGRGGTAFSPVFEAISGWESAPVCLIYFTDLDSSDRPLEPEYPVLWATDLAVVKDGPFGQTIRITAN
jgi:predicted metal-dependent peptidase